MEVRNLGTESIDVIVDAFEAAFGDYAVSFDRSQIIAMLARRVFRPELSFAAFDGDRIAAFTLNGVGAYGGVATCYDCGTGTLPQYRGQGLAGEVFRFSAPILREAGIEKYLLEVLKDNKAAISVYRSNGFEVCADYKCYGQAIDAIQLRKVCDWLEFRPLGVDKLRGLASFCDFEPSWQNSVESIVRGADGLVVEGAFSGDACIGYVVVDPATGDIAQLAVAPEWRRRGVGSSLMGRAVRKVNVGRIKVLNVDADCGSLSAFLASVGIPEGLAQYAMQRIL